MIGGALTYVQIEQLKHQMNVRLIPDARKGAKEIRKGGVRMAKGRPDAQKEWTSPGSEQINERSEGGVISAEKKSGDKRVVFGEVTAVEIESFELHLGKQLRVSQNGLVTNQMLKIITTKDFGKIVGDIVVDES